MLKKYLDVAREYKASDIHFSANNYIMLRVNGILFQVENSYCSTEDINCILNEILQPSQFDKLKIHQDIDTSYTYNEHRYRINIYYKGSNLALAFRSIPAKIPDIKKLYLPATIYKLVNEQNGLILVTGPTGSGKTTTLASMIDHINNTKPVHILTLENPIEYVHQNKKALISQREIYTDVADFSTGLRSALRQDPDILLLGEMRDYESISAGLTAAETGHLVLATLHTSSAAQTIDRLIDVFPGNQQNQIRSQLSNSLKAIISQMLYPRIDGQGLIPACEILINNSAIQNLIRDNKSYQINNHMALSSSQGMKTMSMSVNELVRQNLISSKFQQ